MAFTSQYRMPGTYFDAQPAGVHPGVFRPPASPSAGSSYCFARANSFHAEANTPSAQAKRKRRNDASRAATPLNQWNDGTMNLDGSSELPRHETPLPIRGARYTLAGQLETPGAGISTPFDNGNLDESMYSDGDYRRALGSKRPHEEMESPIPGQPMVLVQPSHPVAGGWSRFAFNTIGGVVGKVWEFCKAGAFIGFSAGGGKAYTIDGQSIRPFSAATSTLPVPQPEPSEKFSEKYEWRQAQSPQNLESHIGDTTPPGGFPQPNFTSYAQEPHQALNPEPEVEADVEATPSRPAVKRRQTSAGNHDELRNWVVVDESAPGNRPVSRASMRPASRNMRPSMVTGRRISVPKPRLSSIPIHNRRQSITSHEYNVSDNAPLSYQEPASFASVRSPEPPRSLTGPSPSRIPLPMQSAGSSPNPFAKTTVSARRQSAIPSPAQSLMSPPVRSHRRSNSSASAASPRGKLKEFGVDSIRASPRLGVEAKKLAARRIKDEHDTDARINDFNQRLKEMIRQGREALGTKVEVDDDGCGWEDD